MLHIIINEKEVQLLAPLPEKIYHYEIVKHPIVQIQIADNKYQAVKDWFNTITNRLTCSHMSYNGVLIPVEDLGQA